MADEKGVDPNNLLLSLKKAMDGAARASEPEPKLVALLRQHMGGDPRQFPIVTETFDTADHPNLQLALDGWLSDGGRSFELEGVVGDGFMATGLADVLSKQGAMRGVATGPVQYRNWKLADDRVLACVQSGLYLVRFEDRRLALYAHGPTRMMEPLRLDVMAKDKAQADQVLSEIRTAMRKRNVYRGQVVSLGVADRDITVKFHRLPNVSRDAIVLPDGLLDRVERLTIGFARNREKLLAAGRHLKRGILLHGPPGTGKTLTGMYLASRMKDRTVILITGREMGLLRKSCALARLLQPAIVVLEDVDLIAEDRASQNACNNVLLFELLNEMDGLADDADVIFLLTTNRPQSLESALASRPGRVDQAIEVPLPDAACRGRLVDLYGRGLILELKERERFVARTEGVSAAFIRELMRRAATIAADDPGDKITVRDSHIDEALHELITHGGELTKSLLGASSLKE